MARYCLSRHTSVNVTGSIDGPPSRLPLRLPRWRIPRARRSLARLRFASALRVGPGARGFRRRAAAPPVGPQEDQMLSFYGTTFEGVEHGKPAERLAAKAVPQLPLEMQFRPSLG
jgi:hypothetical protein